MTSQTIQFLQSCRSDDEIDTVRLVDCLIIDAVKSGASDIHIEPWESSVSVRVRLSGVLNELVPLPSDMLPKIVGRLKVMANLIGHETTLPQEGRAPTFEEAGNVVLRISTSRPSGVRRWSSGSSTRVGAASTSTVSASRMTPWRPSKGCCPSRRD
jgi:type II secretory ATPase GspE/PulE/Tfp pilus assembly ATPase PilB-like protein